MSLGKNLGKLKQWTSEKIGGAEKTDTSDDFKQLELETDQRRESLEKLEATLDVYLKALSKRKPTADDKGKTMPIEALGTCMVNQSYVLGEESPYGKALSKAGQAHEKIATNQGDFVAKVRGGYYANLDRSLTDMKDYNNLRKKLENRRLDLDAKLSKVQKAKKEKPELEEEMRAAQVKYDDTLSDVRARMVIIAEAEEYHVRDLTMFVEAELAHYQKAVEILTPVLGALKEISAAPKPKKYLNTPINNGSASIGRSLTYSESRRRLDYESEDGGSVHSSGSFDDVEQHRSSPLKKPSATRVRAPVDRPTSAVPVPSSGPPPVPRRKTPKKQVRCTFDFDPADEDELKMWVGEIITVTKEVDEGWWVGEVVDSRPKRSGMFPVNYTEPYDSAPPTVSHSFDDSDAWTVPAEAHYDDPEQVYEDEEEEARPSRPVYRRANTASSTASFTHSAPTRNSSSHSNNETSRGAPPRPSGPKPGAPASAGTRSATVSVRASPRASHLRLPGDTPAANMAAAVGEAINNSNMAACRECGCDDFSPNVFKKGACNNCFHKH